MHMTKLKLTQSDTAYTHSIDAMKPHIMKAIGVPNTRSNRRELLRSHKDVLFAHRTNLRFAMRKFGDETGYYAATAELRSSLLSVDDEQTVEDYMLETLVLDCLSN